MTHNNLKNCSANVFWRYIHWQRFKALQKKEGKKGHRQKEKGEKSKNSDPAVCEIVINKLLHLDAVFPLYTSTPTQME